MGLCVFGVHCLRAEANQAFVCIFAQFWNVKIVSRRPNSPSVTGCDAPEPAYAEEEQRETHASLKDKQIKMEQQVYRIWT